MEQERQSRARHEYARAKFSRIKTQLYYMHEAIIIQRVGITYSSLTAFGRSGKI